MGGWAYMLRCSDGSYYVESTSYDDIDVRVGEHNEGKFEGYTSKRRPVKLVWCDQYGDLRDVQAAERRVKGWSRAKKEALIRGDYQALTYLAKRPGARHPLRIARHSEAASACFEAPLRGAPQHDALLSDRHPEVRAAQPRASKDDGCPQAQRGGVPKDV
jgi:putative endonuclease